MLPIALPKLDYASLQRMVKGGGFREGRALDFKRDLPSGKDDDKKEFLADVSSLANALGGDLVFGVVELEGEATAIPGVSVLDRDVEAGRIESLLRTGLEPRLLRHELKWLEGPERRHVLVIRVPRSLAAPHRVTFKEHAKFYSRNSMGKYSMDTSELRSAFLASETLIEQIRGFRTERLNTIANGEAPVSLQSGACAVLHIIPLSSFSTRNDVVVGDYGAMLPPLGAGMGCNSRHTLEGHATFYPLDPRTGSTSAYTLLFRSGAIEAAFCIGATSSEDNKPYIPASHLEWPPVLHIKGYLDGLAMHEIEPPFYFLLSLLNVRGHRLVYGSRPSSPSAAANRDRLFIPEIIVDDMSKAADQMLRPMFDMVWNAFGFPRALTFDPSGNYNGQRY